MNSQVSGTPPKKAPGFIRESQSSKSSVPPEELAFLKAENTRLEGELQASVDNLLIVVDEVKFLEDDVCLSSLHIIRSTQHAARSTQHAARRRKM